MAGEDIVRYLARHVSIVLVGAPDSFVVVCKRVAVRCTEYLEGEIGSGERRALQTRREIVLERTAGHDNRGDSIAARFNQES